MGANIGGEDQLEFESVDANRVLAAMDAAGNRVNIIILDACRDNPYARSFRSGSRGLAQMEAAKGSLVAFATGPGSVASDGAGRNGLYTQHLLQSLNHPESDIDKVFRRVTADVTRATGNRQVPWKADSLTGEFYFRLDGAANVALAPPTAPAPQADARADDRALWETVKDSNNAAELQAYLEQFPSGIFAGVARARLKTLGTARPPVQVATAAPSTLTPKPAPAVAAGAVTDFTPGTSFRDCDVCPEMVVIPPGSFTIGSPTSETGRFDQEGPQRRVTIPGALAVGKFEVTRGEYAQFVQETARATGACNVFRDGKWQEDASKNWRDPGYAQHDTHPVACVNWDDAKAYVAWLSRNSGRNYRLLTEAEWEYTARAGTTTAYYWGDNAANNCQYANGADQTLKTANASATNVATCTDNHAYTAPVGSFQANAFGLHDMSGNVWEWTEDCWNANHNGAPSDGGARTSGECGLRVLRGGSWYFYPRGLRSAYRDGGTSVFRVNGVGFRVARTL